MTTHKRKASQELSRISVNLEEDDCAASPSYIRSLFTWSWWIGLCKSWFAPIVSTNMPQTSGDAVMDTHIQSHQPRDDIVTSLKRQKIRRSKSARSKFTVDEHRRAGRGKLDCVGCVTEDDVRRRIDDFWAPPELGMFGRSSLFNSLGTLEPSEAMSDEEGNSELDGRRRYSYEIFPPKTPESMSPLPSPHPSPTTNRMARIPRTPNSLTGANVQSYNSKDDDDISKQLEGLFVTLEDEQGQKGMLGLSTLMKGVLAKRAKEREAKERAAALCAAKERRLTRRSPLKPLVQSLSDRWEGMVTAAQYEPNAQRIIAKAIKGTELRCKDFRTLLVPRSWLNDEIINAYLEWIEDAANNTAKLDAVASGERTSDVPKFIAHNSFFYETLVNKGVNQTERLMKRRKAAGKLFLQTDTMFVPICKGSHWTVGVVRPIAKTIEYFDSMGGSSQSFVQLMRKWLKFQLGGAYIEDEWKVPRTSCAVQNNGYDCGVFVCTNSFCVASGLDTSCYTETDMIQQRRNIAAVLINRGFVGDFAWGKSGF